MTLSSYYGVSADQVHRYAGREAQLARVESLVETNGPGAGSRRLHLDTGGGLAVDLHPDRALDLGRVTFAGVPVAWLSPTGIPGGAHQDSADAGFLKTFGGGLLATCGMDTFGPPSTDEGREYGTHGRFGALPATIETVRIRRGKIRVVGTIRQATVFGENIEVRRTISARVGGHTLRVTDEVTNRGDADQAHMVLYHANFGWPLLSPESTLEIAADERIGIDEYARAEMAEWGRFHEPTAGIAERVYRHDPPATEAGSWSRARLTNPTLGISAEVRFDRATLGHLYEWKMLGEGTYVLGLEPSNCPTITGRAAARAAGTLPVLAPGETVRHRVEFAFARLGSEAA
ncbi:aldose 1-epimerase family protein [Mycetocola tolaasinivorans]|uniref:aldose 1-epimerase family protein n=1 Tax=Mycetocola tolaasinivorans TaxID=76635 RepID=UPI001603EF94|nr:aldose 1-epimerase family protein [Mycetocola tolaasinivorans]